MSSKDKLKEALFALEKDLDQLIPTVDDEKILSEEITVEEMFVRFRKILITNAALTKIMVALIKDQDSANS